MISDLPRDLAERVLSRLPVTSLGGVRSTCKNWRALSKDRIFTKRHISEAKAAAKKRKEFQVVMMLDFRVYLFNVNFTNLLNTSMERIGKLVSPDRIEISQIFHCSGLLLCITKDKSRLVVWNPCSGQTRWIEPPRNSYYDILDRYALGYEMKKDKYSQRPSLKVLRFVDDYNPRVNRRVTKFEIYNLNSNSWKVVDCGNTYWCARQKHDPPRPDFLICFDFTTERFGPRLPLPFRTFWEETVTLSSVGETQLAVLCQKSTSLVFTVKIWITSEIGPNTVSWRKLFLAADMKPLIGFQFMYGSFFVDEKKKVAVVVDKDSNRYHPTRNMAYIIGKKGYVKQVDLGESRNLNCFPRVCSFVPSSMQINHRGNHNTL
ncbi:hypothetical protein Bca52824_073297 [Brassica carinata]|uniref:F-box domain-containing protein n=1 Tax=Brassica carinata TaxID=52824 RepID=A0A8X7QAW2_BRACI|nr:hypothetical protein Bca52824_073297 [Brassica carinata]